MFPKGKTDMLDNEKVEAAGSEYIKRRYLVVHLMGGNFRWFLIPGPAYP